VKIGRYPNKMGGGERKKRGFFTKEEMCWARKHVGRRRVHNSVKKKNGEK